MALIILIDLGIVVSLVVASRRRLENALPIFCFFLVLMPFEARIVLPGLFDLTTERVELITLLALYLFRRHRAPGRRVPLARLMIVHVAWVVCSTLYSLAVAVSIKQLIALVVEYYLLYFLFVQIISRVQIVYKIVYAMMIAIGVCCICGMFEAYASWSVLSIFPSGLWTTYGNDTPLYIEWGRGLRVRSTFPHPILFGDALAMSIPLALYLLSVWKRKQQRVMLWAATMLMFWGVYKTSSRGPWIALGISCVLLFLLVKNRVRRYLIIICALTVCVVVSRPGIRQTIVNLYVATYDMDSPVGTSYEFRGALADAITAAVGKSPGRALWGYGPGTFRELGLEMKFLGEVEHSYTCDNNWALFLYETGYGGVLLIGCLLLLPLVMTLRAYKRLPQPERYFSGVIFISLAGFYFMLLSVAGYSWGQQGFMAWVLIALSVVYPRIVVRDRRISVAAEEAVASPAIVFAR